MTLIETLVILVASPILSAAQSVGFYTATGFDGDEEFDAQTIKRKRDWPKPGERQTMILWWVRFYLGRTIPHKWTKPIYQCLPCMGSLHSIPTTLLLLWVVGVQWWLGLIMWMMIALFTLGVNKLITVWWR